jgi:hypothetical protein
MKNLSAPLDAGSTQAPEMPGTYDPDPPVAAPKIGKKRRESVLHVLTLSDVLNYEPAPGSLLVGDGVLEAGGTTLLFGPPGSLKGFAIGHLMACGARGGGTWMGYKVNCQFASLWINCENGRRRLMKQFNAMDLPADAGQFIFNTDIPEVWSVTDGRFVEELKETILANGIKLVVFDTVSSFTPDEMAKDFAAFFAGLNAVFQTLPWKVAVLLVHHARKPKDGDRSARGLLHTISGHQTLQRRSRCILFMGRVTDALDERRIVSVCLKCSDSEVEEGRKIAVTLNQRSEMEEIPDFDWSEWAAGTVNGGGKKGPAVSLEHLRTVFENGEKWMRRSEARDTLMEVAGVGRSTAYDALSNDGDYGEWIRENSITKKISIRQSK